MFNTLHSYKVCHTHIYTNQSGEETTLSILFVCLFFLKKKLLVH